MIASDLGICASATRRILLTVALAFPFAGCAEAPLQRSSPTTAVSHSPQTSQDGFDCLSLSTLPGKRGCLAKQDEAFIEDCERMRPMACKPYRELYFAEKTLQQTQAGLLQSAKLAYASYTENDPAYLDDLASNAQAADTAWLAYREAQCALEPFAQGMSRSESENLTEACRLSKTRAYIAELEALRAATGR